MGASGRKQELERLLAYDDWANRETLASLRGGALPAACKRLAHIVAAEWTWFHRLTGGPRVEVWPELDLDACAREIAELKGRWREFLSTLAEEKLDRKVAYTNTKGRAFESTVGEILVHVVLHGAYHRGQVAADVRAHGREPAYTDFIHATREEFV